MWISGVLASVTRVHSLAVIKNKNSCDSSKPHFNCVRTAHSCPAVWSKFHKDYWQAEPSWSQDRPQEQDRRGRNHCSEPATGRNCRLDISQVISPLDWYIIQWYLWCPHHARWSCDQSMSSTETYYNSDSNNNSCLSLNSVDIKRNPISSQLSGQDYIHFSAPGLKKSKRSKGKKENPKLPLEDKPSAVYIVKGKGLNEKLKSSCSRYMNS